MPGPGELIDLEAAAKGLLADLFKASGLDTPERADRHLGFEEGTLRRLIDDPVRGRLGEYLHAVRGLSVFGDPEGPPMYDSTRVPLRGRQLHPDDEIGEDRRPYDAAHKARRDAGGDLSDVSLFGSRPRPPAVHLIDLIMYSMRRLVAAGLMSREAAEDSLRHYKQMLPRAPSEPPVS